MARAFHLTIASPSEVFFDGDASDVSLPASEGRVQILAGHEPLITTLRAGSLTYTTADTEKSMQIESGVVEVAENHCTILL